MENFKKSLDIEFEKYDSERGLLSGWIVTCKKLNEETGEYDDYYDRQGHCLSEEATIDASIEWSKMFREANFMHQNGICIGSVPYLHMVTEDDVRGETIFKGLNRTGLYGTMQVEKEYRHLYKNGNFPGFSIEGSGDTNTAEYLSKSHKVDLSKKSKEKIKFNRYSLSKLALVDVPAQEGSGYEIIKNEDGKRMSDSETLNNIDNDSEAEAPQDKEKGMSEKLDKAMLEKQLAPDHKNFYDSLLGEKEQENFLKADFSKRDKIVAKADKEEVLFKSDDEVFRKSDVAKLVKAYEDQQAELKKMKEEKETQALRKQASELAVFEKSEDLAMVIAKAFNDGIEDEEIRSEAYKYFSKAEAENPKVDESVLKKNESTLENIKKALEPKGAVVSEESIQLAKADSPEKATKMVDNLVNEYRAKEPGISEYEARDKVYQAHPELKRKELGV